MAIGDKPKRREEIESEIKEREEDLEERAEKEGQVVEDKVHISDAAKELNLAGTEDGADQIKELVTEAETGSSRPAA